MRMRNVAIIAALAAVVVVVSGIGASYAYWGDGDWCFSNGRWCL